MKEIRENKTIGMTSEVLWDPFRVGNTHVLQEEEERRSIISNISINDFTITKDRPEEPQL